MREKAHALMKKALDLQLSGQLESAISLYKESIETFPTAEAFTYLGWSHGVRGELDKAIAYCHKAIETDPDFGNPYNDIGAYLVEMGQDYEALTWFYRAMSAPRYDCPFFPHVNMARVYENHSHLGKALLHYQRALELKPDYEVARLGLARVMASMN